MSLPDKVPEMHTREELSAFVHALRDDLISNEGDWENPTLERFMEALAAWIEDMPGYFANTSTDETTLTKWKLFATMLLAARSYEDRRSLLGGAGRFRPLRSRYCTDGVVEETSTWRKP